MFFQIVIFVVKMRPLIINLFTDQKGKTPGNLMLEN